MELLDDIDELRIYRGDDFYINSDSVTSQIIKISQPTLGQICDFGERRYLSMVHTLCYVGADLKWQLDDMGIDYTQISDFELFYSILSRTYPVEYTSILFGNVLDFSKMKVLHNSESDEDIMIQIVDKDKCIIIDKLIYRKIVGVLRRMHNMKRNDEIPGNEATRLVLIEDAKEEYENLKDKTFKSNLQPLISAMVNSPGFKHDEVSVFNMKICPFMDSVARIGKIKNADLLLQSGYSGFGVDLKKIDKKELNWLGELK